MKSTFRWLTLFKTNSININYSKLFIFLFFLIIFFGITGIKVEAATYHVAKDGSKDFIKIQDAANVAQPGDTIIVHEGIYRERVTPPRGGTSETMRITYMAAPGETVYIKGSEIWTPAWLKTGNVSYAKPDDSMFNDDVYVDDKNPFRIQMVGTPNLSLGQVFVDGMEYKENYSNVVSNVEKTWKYENSTGNIYIHFPDGNPTGHVVEITTRRSIFRPHIKGLQYITVKGFIMEHCGNNAQFGRNVAPASVRTHHAALDARGGRYWIIENNTVRYARTQGIDAGGYTYTNDNERNPEGQANASYNIIRNNVVMYNGLLGIGVSMHHPFTAGVVPGKGVEITGNWIEGNDYLGIQVAEFGGIKTHYFHDSIIANNVIIGQGRVGIWMDQGWENNRVTGNIFFDNGRSYSMPAGLYMEGYATPLGRETVIDNNIIFDGIKFLDAQGLIIAQNYIKGLTVFYGQYGSTRATIGRLTIINNLFTVSAFDTKPDDNVANPMGGLTNIITINGIKYPNKITNNVMGVTSFTHSVSSKIITGTLTVDDRPFNDVAPLPISKIVGDYFNNPYDSSIVKGPFQDLVNGANSYTFWPKNNDPLPDTVSAPAFDPPSGTYSSPRSVILSTSTTGATIHYTKDGTTPTESSPIYSTPINISTTTTIKAGAWKTGLTLSSVSSAIYTITSPPTVTPVPIATLLPTTIPTLIPAVINNLTLTPGWNQVSSPIAEGIDISTIESSCTIVPLNNQKLWNWDAQTQSWTNPSRIEPFKGYWINAANSCTVTLSGTPSTSTGIQLYTGWNKISASGNLNDLKGTCGIIDNRTWNWDSANKNWTHPSTLQPDKAYWIKVTGNCALD